MIIKTIELPPIDGEGNFADETWLDYRTVYMNVPTVEEAIAPIEHIPTASRPYSAGDYFFLDGVFCRAKVAIAQGSRFTLNTNYEEKILAVELAALNQ